MEGEHTFPQILQGKSNMQAGTRRIITKY